MNILQIGSYLFPDLVGGAEISAKNYSDHLTAAGHTVSTLTWEQGQLGKRNQIFGERERVWRLRSYRPMEPLERGTMLEKAGFYLLEFSARLPLGALETVARTDQIDIAIVHSFRGLGYDILDQLSKINVPTIIVLHDLALVCMNKSMSRNGSDCHKTCAQCKIVQDRTRTSLRAIDNLLLIGPSLMIIEAVQRELSLFHAKTIHLPNANKYHVTPRVRSDDKALLEFGYFGRLEPDKGVPGLLDMFKTFSADDEAKLHIAGDGSLREEVELYAKTHPNVEYHGFVAPDQMPALYDQIDCLLLPSMWKENFPGVAVQAISSGAPVIAFDTGGVSEIVIDGECGFLVERGDFAGMSQSMKILIDDLNLLRVMSERSIELSNRYEVGHLAAKLVSEIENFSRPNIRTA